jgi:hypothetical protein
VEARSGNAVLPAGGRIAAIVAVTVIVLAAILAVGELRYRSCIEAAEARYPAVPVSAFTGRSTGPVKVSFVRERANAVEGCGRI